MFSPVLRAIIDFLYPKDRDVILLESLTPSTLLEKLTPAQDLEKDHLALFSYTDPSVRKLIWELKYKKNEKIAKTLASLLYDVLKAELSEKALFESALWLKDPLLIPMPSSKKRRREKGYNQTELLCEELKLLDTENILNYSPNVLLKHRHTESQTLTKDKKKREENISNSMSVRESVRLDGAHVILVDDVMTTGATFRDARRALRESGAKRILSVSLAH